MNRKDASHHVIQYEDMKKSIITNVQNIKAVVDRVKSGEDGS